MPRFKCYHLVNDKPEIFNGLDVYGLTSGGSRIRVRFKPGYIFGVQWIPISQIDKRVTFEHLDTTYTLFFTNEELSSDEIRKKLIGNFL